MEDARGHGGGDRVPYVDGLGDRPSFDVAVAFTPRFVDRGDRGIGRIHESEPDPHNEERVAELRLSLWAINPCNRLCSGRALVEDPGCSRYTTFPDGRVFGVGPTAETP